MKCIKCNKNANKKDRERANNRCPSCHHPFVAIPDNDGLTDMHIKKAQDVVSANGTLFFTKAHLKYQLQRVIKKKLKTHKIVMVVVLLVTLSSLLGTFIKNGFFIPIAFFGTFISIVIVGAYFKQAKTLNRLDSVLNQWVRINAHEKLLTAERYAAQQSPRNLDSVSFDRVLVCDRNDTVDFFLSNLFHFHYSCPVLGGNGYPKGICDDMLTRLKQNPNLKVFLLHDYSPAGADFVRRMKTESGWFKDLSSCNIIDLGLNAGQEKLFKEITTQKRHSNQGLQETAEISLFKPAALIALCGAALNEELPLHLIPAASAADSAGSSTGYG